jgi:DNA polymerase III alpha subunit
MTRQQLFDLCLDGLKQRNITTDDYKNRFSAEWKEITSMGEDKYFAELIENKTKFKENENNLIIPYLLGIVNDFDIDKQAKFIYGEWPDIDIDYIDGVREYLKEDYAKKAFGEQYVCNIANYNTFGMKSALKDMARLFSLPHEEVDAVTKNMKDKDEDGKILTWDQAVEIYDEFREYCEKNPEVAEAAKQLVGRIRGQGQHASGLVVSRVPIHEHIPLIRGKEGSVAAAWPEGQSSSDLSIVGFIKFDFLGLDGNQKIASACKMACLEKEEYEKWQDKESDLYQTSTKVLSAVQGVTVCALPGENQPSWSDTSYLEDKKCLEMANRGDLRMVFQFDGSAGIRNMAKEGGVDKFDDLVAYTSLFRPGPMKLGAHEQYIKRKRGTEEWSVHPLLAEGPANLQSTYGVHVYQEQISRVLHTVGKIPLGDCETVRKAISKKKIEKFQKYKDMFIANGQITLGATIEELEHLWALLEAFAGYGFNQSHAVGYCYISSRMLWLKCHLPKQFFASMLTHTKTSSQKDYDKLKEYKRESERNKVKIERLHLNKSKNEFVADDKYVYWGFCKIKGIGEDAAKRIEELQPFAGIEDFLTRYGTDAKVVQPLIALGCFQEADPLTLATFYEAYKDYDKKENDRNKRFLKNKEKLEAEITEATDADKIKLEKKLATCIANKYKKDDFAERPTLTNFNHDFKIKADFLEILKDKTGEAAEVAYYGFVWQHPIEKLTNYQGLTIAQFIEEGEKHGQIEVLLKEVKQVQGPKATYYSVQFEDSAYMKRKMTLWQNDYERFKDEFVVGNYVRLHVDAPKPPYPTYGLHQFPGGKWKMPKKESDYRVVSLT